MATKLHRYTDPQNNPPSKVQQLWFFCPGCKNTHAFTVGGDHGWTWNNSMDAPTFSPSLLCNPSHPESRCHSFVKDGKIEFLDDCWHELRGQTIELPDWED